MLSGKVVNIDFYKNKKVAQACEELAKAANEGKSHEEVITLMGGIMNMITILHVNQRPAASGQLSEGE